MLCVYAMDFQGAWHKHLPFVEFTYNNSFQTRICVAPYEALYERKFRTPLCWNEVSERKLQNVELIKVTIEKIKFIQNRLKSA